MKKYLIIFILLVGCAGSSVERHPETNTYVTPVTTDNWEEQEEQIKETPKLGVNEIMADDGSIIKLRDGDFRIQYISDEGVYMDVWYGSYNMDNVNYLQFYDKKTGRSTVFGTGGDFIISYEQSNGKYYTKQFKDGKQSRGWVGEKFNLDKPDYPVVYDDTRGAGTVCRGQAFIAIEKFDISQIEL